MRWRGKRRPRALPPAAAAATELPRAFNVRLDSDRTASRRRIHPQGPEFSRIIAGAWRFQRGGETSTPEALARFIAACVDCGVTSFDHAAVYGGYQTEALFGAALKLWKGRRDAIEIITKCSICGINPAWPDTFVKHYDSSAAHIRASLDRSLRELGTDYVDLLLIHRPDPLMDAGDCARGLEEAVKSGKARAAGVSNHAPGQFALLQSRLAIPLVTNQIEFSALSPGALFDGTLDQAQQLRASPMAWSPLGGGGLFTDAPAAARLRAALLSAAGRRGGADIAVAALAWLLMHPSRPFPVLGTAKIARIREAVSAEVLPLTRQDWFAILEAGRGAPLA